ncbi:MAG: hypothetical protein JNM72_07990 [Deltaproteobacteria bacterium]|nr:hypothetical protein [Deltaproteobacteria bacterium]
MSAPLTPPVLGALPPALGAAARRIAAAVGGVGGVAYLVGGAVRDALLGLPIKDLDLEVHGLDAEALASALRRVGPVRAVGRSFGVFKLRVRGLDEPVDVALPRGLGPRAGGGEVAVVGDPHVGIDAALRGRDLSINAMAVRLPDGALVDPCGGQGDLAAGLLRPADPLRFGEDPLRALRAARFAARFGFALSPALVAACAGLPVGAEPVERRITEVEAILLGPRPAVGLAALRALGVEEAALPGLGGAPLPAAPRLPAPARRPTGEALAVALVALLAARRDAAPTLLDGLGLHSRGGFPVRAQVLAAWPWLDAAPAEAAGPLADRWLRRGAELLRVDLALEAAAATDADPVWPARLDRAWALGVQAAPLLPLVSGAELRALGLPPGPLIGAAQRLVRAAQLDGQIADPEAAVALVRAALAEGALAAGPPRRDRPAAPALDMD